MKNCIINHSYRAWITVIWKKKCMFVLSFWWQSLNIHHRKKSWVNKINWSVKFHHVLSDIEFCIKTWWKWNWVILVCSLYDYARLKVMIIVDAQQLSPVWITHFLSVRILFTITYTCIYFSSKCTQGIIHIADCMSPLKWFSLVFLVQYLNIDKGTAVLWWIRPSPFC